MLKTIITINFILTLLHRAVVFKPSRRGPRNIGFSVTLMPAYVRLPIVWDQLVPACALCNSFRLAVSCWPWWLRRWLCFTFMMLQDVDTFLVNMMMTHHVSPSPPLVVQYSCMPAQALKQHVQKATFIITDRNQESIFPFTSLCKGEWHIIS